MATPNLNLPNTPAGATDISVAYNEAIQIIDALLPLVVQSMALTAPPSTVSGDVGKRWIVAAAPTGVWAGQAGKVALCTAADTWKFITAPVWHYARNLATNSDFRQTAAGTWTAV